MKEELTQEQMDRRDIEAAREALVAARQSLSEISCAI